MGYPVNLAAGAVFQLPADMTLERIIGTASGGGGILRVHIEHGAKATATSGNFVSLNTSPGAVDDVAVNIELGVKLKSGTSLLNDTSGSPIILVFS